MIKFTLYTSNYVGELQNCKYPNMQTITDKVTLAQAVSFDHVSAAFKNNYRSAANFISADNVVLDCDNDHSDIPEDWVTPKDLAKAFDSVAFAAVYSRNNMKQKGNKSARPRFHIYFMIPEMSNPEEYTQLKQSIAEYFPYFDSNALDSARFIFGKTKPIIEIYDGDRSVTELIGKDAFAEWEEAQETILEGSRNSTMSRHAARLIKRYGDSEEAHNRFIAMSEKCNPPLESAELDLIWQSAVRFGARIAKRGDYIPPDKYNAELALKPQDYSDVGQAEVLAREYIDRLRYSPSTGFIVYNGEYWEECNLSAQVVVHELTERQLEEAEDEIKMRLNEMKKSKAHDILTSMSQKKALELFSKKQLQAYRTYEEALAYRKFVMKNRDSNSITAVLKEVRPLIMLEQNLLDSNEFLLNTPTNIYDLRKGIKGQIEKSSKYYLSRQTQVSPSDKGKKYWDAALNIFFCGDSELAEYVQKIVGLAAIGKVYVEALIIAYGEGRNGKSTFWNVVSRVLGSYSGNISADVLTIGCRRNVKPELAEAKGKRLLIAAELEEGMRLSTSNVKQLCSTDEIYAEKKYKDPFSYTPSHTLVLYTNHLPKVGAIDKGTWRRLIVIPFDAKIEGTQDVKNYADYLYENAGGAVLKWIIEGARKVINDNYRIEPPQKVKEAIQTYKENNDWLSRFIEERCETGKTYTAKSGELYSEYRAYCMQCGEYIRSTTDFYTALDTTGYERKRTKKGTFIKGFRLKSEFLQ